MKSFLLILLSSLTLSSVCTSTDQVPSSPSKAQAQNSKLKAQSSKGVTDTLTIAMTGDIMMGTTFPSTQLPPNDGRDIFMDTKEITSRADLP